LIIIFSIRLISLFFILTQYFAEHLELFVLKFRNADIIQTAKASFTAGLAPKKLIKLKM